MKALYWTEIDDASWRLIVVATDEGLSYVSSPAATLDEVAEWCAKHYPGYTLTRDDERLGEYSGQLRAYLNGELTRFQLPLHVKGTAFQQMVWQALEQIPHGQTCSYSDIAERIGKASAVRAVGTAIGANPVLIVVPCHRVIGKNGALTGFRGGMDAKEKLLRLEGVLASR
ncbi:methylated-DNA--[protein]-cysteine S-methyltransferase [Paenibacillus sp. CF384]|uniref:methylated-DNA--[protein]-cysteine S-methyltransferase n=1 Tax=Paenibacillus sp. CF384 TaxID=1884382 RepID=UPI000899261C|nr:methylated-DNA--[protein]-cysteine S-methyltransferase [Paenibacillus sp. CF384]SDX51658.1 methylated-DNA-[protein]-cysteine S-methyltransferase [Paenibacillus sp. CF384]